MGDDARSVSTDPGSIGREAYSLVKELYPICRSITGDGLRQTLEILRRFAPLEVHEVPSGTRVFDWTIPDEWNIRDAWVKDPRGRKVIDFAASNLHVVGYSTPIHEVISLQALRPHLFTLPDRPGWIPYRTSYYERAWGFCLRHDDLLGLKEGDYEVFIDSRLEPGSLSYGESYWPGSRESEVLVSVHTCHPALCNDNLSGVAVAVLLARHLASVKHRLSYRFLFIPGTIGAIAWLARNESRLGLIHHGLVLSGVGDSGPLTYKKSRQGDAAIDRAFACVLQEARRPHSVVDFDPCGYDERQYCSPGFDLPVGNLSRAPHGRYPEYHTSADNLEFVTAESLGDSFATILQVFAVLERNKTYVNLNPKGEPQLGRRGLYSDSQDANEALQWVLNLSDGTDDLLDIAARSGLGITRVREAAGRLVEAGLLESIDRKSGND
jgi:aminopeptidase-like protein